MSIRSLDERREAAVQTPFACRRCGWNHALTLTLSQRERGLAWESLAACCLLAVLVVLISPVRVASAGSPNPQLERNLVALTNVDRTSNGLTSLLEDDQLIG